MSSDRIPNDVPTAGSGDGDGSGEQGKPLEWVWHRFGDQLRRRARTRLRQYGLAGHAESMDICNDVMAELTRRNAGSAMQPDDVLAYVTKAIDNQVLDTFRTLARQCRDFRRNEKTPIEEIRLPSGQATPSQIAVRREVVERIRSTMNEEDAIAIDMMLANRDWSEIGTAMGVRPDAARMRVRRAIEKVRREIGLGADDD